jgi:hypothetical protein
MYIGVHVKYTLFLSGFNELERSRQIFDNFDVLLTVHLSVFISVINQLDAQRFVLQ